VRGDLRSGCGTVNQGTARPGRRRDRSRDPREIGRDILAAGWHGRSGMSSFSFSPTCGEVGTGWMFGERREWSGFGWDGRSEVSPLSRLPQHAGVGGVSPLLSPSRSARGGCLGSGREWSGFGRTSRSVGCNGLDLAAPSPIPCPRGKGEARSGVGCSRSGRGIVPWGPGIPGRRRGALPDRDGVGRDFAGADGHGRSGRAPLSLFLHIRRCAGRPGSVQGVFHAADGWRPSPWPHSEGMGGAGWLLTPFADGRGPQSSALAA
jgi:hypothetical protein